MLSAKFCQYVNVTNLLVSGYRQHFPGCSQLYSVLFLNGEGPSPAVSVFVLLLPMLRVPGGSCGHGGRRCLAWALRFTGQVKIRFYPGVFLLHFDGFAQDCTYCGVSALDLPQTWAKQMILYLLTQMYWSVWKKCTVTPVVKLWSYISCTLLPESIYHDYYPDSKEHGVDID